MEFYWIKCRTGLQCTDNDDELAKEVVNVLNQNMPKKDFLAQKENILIQ